MSSRFDELLASSAPEMPDPGEYRRLNRASMREPVHLSGRGKRSHTLVKVAACLAFMVMAGGQLNPLGGDDLEMIQSTGLDWKGEKQTLYGDEFTGMVFNSEGSDERVKDLQHFFLSQDSDPVKLDCMAYGGKQAWTVYGMGMVEGELSRLPLKNPSWLPNEDLPRPFEFYPTYYRDIRTRSDLLPPVNQYLLTVYGVEFLVKEWKHTYPGYGEVTYSVGFPVSN